MYEITFKLILNKKIRFEPNHKYNLRKSNIFGCNIFYFFLSWSKVCTCLIWKISSVFHSASLWLCSFSILFFFLSSSSVHSDPSGPVCAGGSYSGLSLRGQRLPSACHSMDSRRWDDIMLPCLFDLLEWSPHYSTVCLSQVWSAFLFSKKTDQLAFINFTNDNIAFEQFREVY